MADNPDSQFANIFLRVTQNSAKSGMSSRAERHNVPILRPILWTSLKFKRDVTMIMNGGHGRILEDASPYIGLKTETRNHRFEAL
jgi:hypothetical protein